MRKLTNKAWNKRNIRRIARRRGYYKWFAYSFRREVAGYAALED